MSNQTRIQLYKDIWNIAKRLKGSIYDWDFKDYVLSFLFYRYISEDFSNYVEKQLEECGDGHHSYENCDDKEEWIHGMKNIFIEEKGFFIYPSQLFSNIRKESQNNIDNLNEILGKVFKDIDSSTQDSGSREKFKGLFNLIDLNSIKLGQEISQRNKRLKEIIDGIAEMQIDIKVPNLFGDVYKYLIEMYLSSTKNNLDDLHTPSGVSHLIANLASEGMGDIRTVYDPACGSGSLLLKFQSHKDIEFYGQEINRTTYDLCRMNMFMHKVNFSKFDIKCGDTLINDYFGETKFDVIVSNLPHSLSWEGKSNPNIRNDKRFYKSGGIAPEGHADFAFIQHSLFHLAENGTAVIAISPGILFREDSEKLIRKWLIENNYVDAIIQLPRKLFYGIAISTCVMVFKKSKPTTDVLFIDASEYFEKTKSQNVLNEECVQEIVTLYRNRENVENLARIVTAEEIKEQDYNLAVGVYLVKKIIREKIDIKTLNKTVFAKARKIQNQISEAEQLVKELEEFSSLDEKFEKHNWEIKTLKEASTEIYSGNNGITEDIKDTGNFPAVKLGDISSLEENVFYECKTFVNPDLIKDKKLFKEGDILLLSESVSPKTAGRVFLYLGKDECIPGNGIYVIKHNQNPSYLLHALNTTTISENIKKIAYRKYAPGMHLRIGKEELEKVKIPFSSPNIQANVANFLNKFSELNRDLKTALIEFQKQYQYYLNLLIGRNKEEMIWEIKWDCYKYI